MHQSHEERLNLAFRRYMATHRFKNDSIAAEYFPIMTILHKKLISNLNVSLYSTNHDYDDSDTILFDRFVLNHVKLRMLNGVGFVDQNGRSMIAIPSSSVDRFTFTQVDSNTYNLSIYFKEYMEDVACWYIYKMQLELA